MSLPLAVLLLAQLPAGGGTPGRTPLLTTDTPELSLDGPAWRPWERQGGTGRARRSKEASATVEVVESLDRERRLLLVDFQARVTPLLRTAFDVGHRSRTNVQMLAEFMAMDPAHPHPPTIPSVFYNNFKPPEENPALKEMKR